MSIAINDLVWLRRLAVTGAARAMRQAAQLSGPEMAREIGISASTLSRWERGVTTPRGEAARRWASTLRNLA